MFIQGFLTVVDMGTVKVLENNERTFTTIGTPHYISPEVYSGKGYSFAADLWSLGVILYEFMCGFVPFGEEESDPYKIYETIIYRKNLCFPPFVKDKKAKHLMEQLLNKNPERRTGGSYAYLKNHPWFSDIDWDKLIEKKISVPYKPSKEKIMTKEYLKDLETKKGIMLPKYKIIK